MRYIPPRPKKCPKTKGYFVSASGLVWVFRKTVFRASILTLLLFFATLLPSLAQDKNWPAITTEELQMKAPKVEPDADAEVIFWEVKIADSYDRATGFKTTWDNHIKIKIFTKRGSNEYNRVDLPFGKMSDIWAESSIKDIAARTIKPDGTVLVVQSSDIFERELLKGKGIRYRAKSFVFPSVEVGSLVEYKWREVWNNSISNYLRLEFAREIPVQYVKYYLKPVSLPGASLELRVDSINTSGNFLQEKGGFYSIVKENLPSYKEEPFMPSKYRVRPWMLLFYDKKNSISSPDIYWRNVGRDTYNYHKSWLSFNEQIKRTAEQLVAGIEDELEQARRIFDFCRREITDTEDDLSTPPAETKKDVKPNKNSTDVLTRKTGTHHDINMLFAAMLNAVNIDARVANVSARTDPRFNREIPNNYFNRAEIIAAKIGSEWKFFSPSSRYVTFGSLPWRVEGQSALISDPNEPFFERTPFTPPEKSKRKLKANLQLKDDGAIVGPVSIEYSGHLGNDAKERFDTSSSAEHEKMLIEMIKREVSDSAEVSEVSIENATDPDKPLIYRFRLSVPAYGQVTGKRLIFVPNLLTRNSDHRFVGNNRRYDISFDHPWSEEDEITYELPKGYLPDSASQPRTIGDANGTHEVNLSFSADNAVLRYSRKFAFGKGDILDFDKVSYQTIKQLFEACQNAGAQSIILLKGSG